MAANNNPTTEGLAGLGQRPSYFKPLLVPKTLTTDTNTQGLVTRIRACGPAGGSVAKGMKKISYRGYRFPPEIIQQAIWLYSGSH
jgi:hypothetical protein